MPPGGSTAMQRQGQPIVRAIGGPEKTDTNAQVWAPPGAPVTPTRGQLEIPAAGATGGPKQAYTPTRRRGAPGVAPETPSTRNNGNDLKEEATNMANPEALLRGNEFLRLTERREIDEDNHCFVVFVREADPEDGYRPAHPRGRRLYTEFEGLFPEELPDGVPARGRTEHAIP